MVNSPILGIPQVAPNQNNKETTINDAFSIIERSLNKALAVDLSEGNAVLVPTDFQRNLLFRCSGNSVERSVVIPNQVRFFGVENLGTEKITVTTETPVSTVEVHPGSFVVMYADGENGIVKIADSAAAALTPTFEALVDADGLEGNAGKFAVVAQDESKLTFTTISFSALVDVDPLVNGYYLRIKADGSGVEFVPANPGGETEFKMLNDVPNDYTGMAGRYVAVNDEEDGLEFVQPIIQFTGLSDTPSSYNNSAGMLLAVNQQGTGIEFIPPPTVGRVVTRSVEELLNPDFEAASTLTDWQMDELGSENHTINAAYGEISEAFAGSFFYALIDEEESVQGSIYQEIDLTLVASATELDNSARVQVGIAFTTLLEGSTGKIKLEAIDSLDIEIGDVESDPLSTELGSWDETSVSMTLPVGTRKLRISLISEGGAENTGFGWDAVRMYLTVTEEASFEDLPDTPTSYEGHGKKFVRVKEGEDGVEYVNLDLRDAINFPNSLANQAGRLLAVNQAENALIFVNPNETGAKKFTELDDTPNSFTGQGGKFLRVKVTENGLEYAEASSGGGGASNFTDLSDVPSSYSGQKGKVLVVNDNENGLEFAEGAGTVVGALDDLEDVDVVSEAPQHGQALIYDAVSGLWRPGAQVGGFGPVDVDISVFIPGEPESDEIVARFISVREITIPAGFLGSYAYAQLPPSGSVVFTVKKNGFSVGTIEFPAETQEGVFTAADEIELAPGDRLDIVSPVATLGISDIGITFAGSR